MGMLTSIDDAALEAEFSFWKTQFLQSTWIAAGGAVLAGALILSWPAGMGNLQLRTFVREVWPPFIECALWFGFLVGLLWAAARRIGCALAGTVPWAQPVPSRPIVVRCFLGQGACCLVFTASLLWIVRGFLPQLGGDQSTLMHLLTQAIDAGFLFAGIFGLFAAAPNLIKDHR